MIQTINFISRREAECEQPSLFSDVLVSIGEPGQPLPNLQNGWRDVLSLQFWDVEEDLHKDGQIYTGISVEQAEQIAEFIKRWHHRDEPVRFTAHCLAGISRSAGVALSTFDYTRAPFPRITMAGRANGLVIQRVNSALRLEGY